MEAIPVLSMRGNKYGSVVDCVGRRSGSRNRCGAGVGSRSNPGSSMRGKKYGSMENEVFDCIGDEEWMGNSSGPTRNGPNPAFSMEGKYGLPES